MKRLVCILLLLSLPACSAQQAAEQKSGRPQSPGERVFAEHCESCHGAGIGNPGAEFKTGTDALRVKYKGEIPALLEERTDLTPETVAFFVRNGVSVMAPYRKTEISDAELAALGAWLSRNNPNLKKQ